MGLFQQPASGIAPRRAVSRRGKIVCFAGWLLAGLLGWAVTLAGQSVASSRPELDRAVLDSELSRPLAELRQQGPEAVRSHVQLLTEIYAALDGTGDVPQAERRAMRDRILTRVAQVGLQARDEGASTARNAKDRGWRATAPGSLGTLDGVLGFLGENSVLLVGLLGGLIVAYSLGRLAGYRRGASEASYYGAGPGKCEAGRSSGSHHPRSDSFDAGRRADGPVAAGLRYRAQPPQGVPGVDTRDASGFE